MAEVGDPLSERELAVLDSLAQGSTNREIARDLDISHNTVKVHLRNIFGKLGVSSRTEATTVALQKGLLAMPGGAGAPDQETGIVESPAPVVDEPNAPVSPPAPSMPSVPSGSYWRLISFVLLLLLALLLAAVAGARILGGDSPAIPDGAGQSEELFEEKPVGNSRWLISRPLPRERANHALAAVGLDLYLIAGEVEAGVVNLLDVFETDTRQWRPAVAKPTAVADTSAAVLFGEIYVVGGRLADGQPTGVVEAYSPANDAWRPVQPLPGPISGGLAISDGSRLYLLGGWDGEAYLAEGHVYDPAQDNWMPVPAMSHPRAFAAGGVLANQIYVVGGSNDSGELAVCETYDLIAEAWAGCPSMSFARAGAGAAVLGNRFLYVVGGGREGDVTVGEAFDTSASGWQELDMPMLTEATAWYDLAVTSVETRIYAMGGRLEGEIVADNYVYAPFVHQTFLPAVGAQQ